MRMTLALCGWLLDIGLGRDDEPEPEPAEDYRGDCVTFPIGFTRPDIPWDHDCPVHQFTPEDSDEDA